MNIIGANQRLSEKRRASCVRSIPTTRCSLTSKPAASATQRPWGGLLTDASANCFLANRKANSRADTNARDSAIAFSFAVQHGADPRNPHPQGRASGPVGAALDILLGGGLSTMRRDDKQKRERERAYGVRLLRGWFKWHHDERDAVLAGPHGTMFERLLDWSTFDATTRPVRAARDLPRRHRATRNGLIPFDDPFPGERENVFSVIKQHLFPAQAAPPGAQPGLDQRNI
jgi:hypothetical protein